MKLGEKIKYLRERRGFSQAQLAEMVGIKPSYVSAIETGDKTNPSRTVTRSFAKALNVKERFLNDESAITYEEFSELAGVNLPEDIIDFLMSERSLRFLRIAKKCEEEKIPMEYIELALENVRTMMKLKKDRED